ncbi:single-stranded DNA-binding protein [Ligilactobacillus pobuzihii]|uniref:Single-stranded DNA-binding protein n=1 Tax=Ligilactobacillus pobuzihii TaxID=449659 RepID=A0A0R2LLE3_9LACO|nr:single-stranded DNA-binding protein [Ligilactobacillus pobuzihii]KRK10939.1 hypothetical protein FD11_GL001209 [Ligilactobacillus pobuzihii E100301 = KCTC 13174]KRN99485.1 hypothetical protein IV66_GL001489 [Ligilactobacillus pobuzihii]GEN48922.1 hypothetical protein LPO01_17140 [Ligilactobacillus pobuzihii]
MNQFAGIGRLTKDVQIRQTSSGKSVGSFTLAINGYNDHTDFIRCQIWDKRADNLAKFTHKGSQIGVTGRINTGSYQDRDGKTVYTTDVVVGQFDLLDPKQDKPDPYNQQNVDDGGVNGPQTDDGQQIDIQDDDLPF